MKINREKTIFDVLYSREAFLNHNKKGLKNSQNWHCLAWFWSKIFNFLHVSFYAKKHPEKVFGDVLARNEAFVENINMDLKTRQNWHFAKGLVHDFGQKVEVFFNFCVHQI